MGKVTDSFDCICLDVLTRFFFFKITTPFTDEQTNQVTGVDSLIQHFQTKVANTDYDRQWKRD